MDVDEFKKLMRQHGCDFKVVGPKDPAYGTDRVIANNRFNYFPDVIAYCASTNDVACCLKICTSVGAAFRVRSGGHQHEGMCSANKIVLIDLSAMNTITYPDDDKRQAWIPSGKPLGKVYKELEAHNRIIPGGACGAVNVGGVTQGGGWGLYTRKLGLTCDNIAEVKVVLADGSVVHASEGRHAKLFWAVRGGGGGNFGVVTKFLFNLTPLDGPLTSFTLTWGEGHVRRLIRTWMRKSPTFTDRMSTFCRLKTVRDPNDAVLVSGVLFGHMNEARRLLSPLYEVQSPVEEEYDEVHYPKTPGAATASSERTQYENLATLSAHLVPSADPPKETCAGEPHPHKISSAFPKDGVVDELAERIVDYIEREITPPSVNTYISLHGFGGAVKNVEPKATAFPYRKKEFMLQFQAWWSDPRDKHTDDYIRWIEKFRDALNGLIEGAFINFPDRLLVPHSETPAGRVKLLKLYYDQNLHRLREAKHTYDPHNRFSFGMSIPPPGTPVE